MKPIILNRNQKRLLLIAAVVVIFLFFMPTDCSCNGNRDVVVPEIKGSTKIEKPQTNNIYIHDTVFIKNAFGQNKSKKEVAIWKMKSDSLQDVVATMRSDFSKSNNKDALFKEVTEPKFFSKTWDDPNLKATVSGLYFGAIPNIQLDYIIKERKIEVPKEKEVLLRFMAGGGLGINSELNQPVLKANAGFQNKKGNIIMASYQKIGSQQYWLAEYNFSVFTIKR